MEKRTLDLLMSLAKIKDDIHLQKPPADNLILIEKFNCKTETFLKKLPFTSK